jgi:hypothetical protein
MGFLGCSRETSPRTHALAAVSLVDLADEQARSASGTGNEKHALRPRRIRPSDTGNCSLALSSPQAVAHSTLIEHGRGGDDWPPTECGLPTPPPPSV